MRLRIILADDHPVVLIGARAVISESGVGEVVAEAGTTDELMQMLTTTPCDVLVTDYSMPGSVAPDGFTMIQAIRRKYPNLPILMLSVASNLGILRMVANAGVLGLVDKTSSMKELPLAIQTIHRGVPYISRSLRDKIDENGTSAIEPASRNLSPREHEVLRLLAAGLSVSEIARSLNRSLTTISRQKGDAMRKLGLSNDAELFQFLSSDGFSP
jgi:two-component system, NarL family, captular synthesis response regulator RcsB